MNRIFIYNFNFAIARENRNQLGTVAISKNGELKLSPTISKSLSTCELVELCKRAMQAYVILTTGDPNIPMINFLLEKTTDRYHIIQKLLNKETCIGHILYKNKKLTFKGDVPEYIRYLCVEQLNDAHETDFYYHGAHYGKD